MHNFLSTATPPPILVDPATQKLQELAEYIDWQSLAARGALQTAQGTYARCLPSNPTLAGADAATYLQSFIPLVEADLLAQHDGYGPVRWLWYLRRAPDLLFEGTYGTTLGYDRALAEAISSFFTVSDISDSINRVSFRVDEAAFRHLARYVGRIKLLSQLHMLYRRAGKGATLDVSQPIFTADSSDSVAHAIEIYDQRHDRSEELTFPGLGLALPAPDVRTLASSGTPGDPVALLSMPCSPSTTAPVTFPNGNGELTVVTARVRHVIRAQKLSAILRPFADSEAPDYLENIAALVELLMLVPAICSKAPWALSSIVQYGYAFVDEGSLRAIIDRELPPIASQLSSLTHSHMWPQRFDELFEALQAVTATSWPLSSGSVLRRFNGRVLIDTTCASQALLSRTELGRSPLHGNPRALLFERQCQTAIDSTHWAPAPSISNLRGRTLRRNGLALTDIDAIGANGGSLLIVSCKSIIYDRAYDRGDFRVVRNIQTTVDDAVATWESILADLRSSPTGDNFDFSEFNQIIGVVCTPFVAYSDNAQSLSFAQPKLRTCVSLQELVTWLNG